MKGYIQVYTGNGKGKTTASFGLAMRAVGSGKKVFIAQFVKGQIYSEINAIEKYLPDIRIEQYGLDCFIVNTPTEKDIEIARRGFENVREIINSGEYDVIILDEANIAVFYDLFSVDELINILKQKKIETEIVITGRYARQELIDFADLVTEMNEIKHYYTRGVQARKGIEF